MILLITTSGCPNCPAAKSWLDANDIEYDLVEADKSADAMGIAQIYGVSSVPTIVDVLDDDNNYKAYSLEAFKESFGDSVDIDSGEEEDDFF